MVVLEYSNTWLVKRWKVECVCVSLCRDSQVEAEQRQNIHMEAQHAFTARRQISDQEDSNDRQESPEVTFKWIEIQLMYWKIHI